jgi:two-component system OmpR family sensor kinase/two-component system phosphate regulon sensor histidine kinase PhoR
VLVFQYQRERDFKRSQLESRLDNISVITHNYIQSKGILGNENFGMIDSLLAIILESNTRITVIDPQGIVLYDSEVDDYAAMENHLHRPEVNESLESVYGASIRESATTGNSYYYYSRFFSEYFIRTAAVYDLQMRSLLHVETPFIIYLTSLFVFISILIMIMTRRFADTILRLKDFATTLSSGKTKDLAITFPDKELADIGKKISSIYEELSNAKEELLVEKNKLHSHLSALNEGIAFFSPEKEKLLTNNHFIHYLNLISEKSPIQPEKIFKVDTLKPLIKFIDKQLKNRTEFQEDDPPFYEMELQRKNRYFNVMVVFFQDFSFEIVITDTTKLEKRRLIKQEMTSNISHELKTPVATVLGYLETLEADNLEAEKKKYFISKAHAQAIRLSELVEDITTVNRIEEAGSHYAFEDVNIGNIALEVKENMQQKLDESQIKVMLDLPDNLIIRGNQSLLFSVFYNLFDNAIKYGGEKIKIKISSYLEDDDFYYFSFSNTGNLIDEKHLSRLFERFYRIDDGRSRKKGGTGLGLSIVKNAILLHGGTISARQNPDKGLEFLFSLGK